MRVELILGAVLSGCVFLVSVGLAADDEAASTGQRLERLFDDDFSKDTRADYLIEGEVALEAGRLTLPPGAILARDLQAGSWVEAEIDLQFPELKAQNPPLVFDFNWVLNGSTPCFVRWAQGIKGNGEPYRYLYVVDTNPNAPENQRLVLIRRWPLAELTSGRWRLAYRNGLITIHSPQAANHKHPGHFAAHTESGTAMVSRIVLVSVSAAVPMRRLALSAAAPPPPISEEQQRELTKADQESRQGMQLYQAGEHEAAAKIFDQVTQVRQKVLGNDHPDYAVSLTNLALLHESMGDYSKAEPLLIESREIVKKALGPEHPHYATSLSNLAALYKSTGDYANAEPLLIKAHDICQKVLGTEHPQFARTVKSLALLYHLMGDYANAEPLYIDARDIDQKLLGTEHPVYAATLNNLADLYRSMGDYAQAEPLFVEAREITENSVGTEHPDYAASLSNLALLYLAMGDYAKAKPLLVEARDILRESPGIERPDYAACLNNLAGLYHRMGYYTQAEPLLIESREICESVLGTEHPRYAGSLNSLAGLYEAMGDYERAERLYIEARDIQQKVLGTEHPSYATTLNNLAGLYEAKGDYAKAEPLHIEARDIRERVLGTEHPDYASSLNNLALLYQSMGDYVKAEPLLIKSREICEGVLGSKHPQYATSLNNLALLYEAMSDNAKAEALWIQARDIRQRALGTEHPDYAQSLSNLAGLYVSMRDYAKAEPFASQAVEITRRQLDATAAIQSERQQLAMLAENRRDLDSYLAIGLAGQRPARELFAECLLWRGAVFVRQQALRQLRRQDDPDVQRLLAELTETARRRSVRLFQTPPPGQTAAWQQELASLAARQEQLEAELGRRSAEFRQGEQAAELTPSQLQTLLAPGSAVIDWLEYSHRNPQTEQWERRLLAFLVTGKQVTAHDFGSVAPLKRLVETWHAEIQQGGGSDSASAQSLRQQLWDPLEAQLEGIETVLISPDGLLTGLPFAALPGETAGSYLLEEKTIITIPFPQMLKLWKDADEPAAGGNLLLVGDVDFNQTAEPAGTTSAAPLLAQTSGTRAATGTGPQVFAALPGTRQEIERLAALHRERFPGREQNQLRGAEATEDALKALTSGRQVIHLATHGFFASPEVVSLARHQEPDRMSSLSTGDSQQRKAVGYPPGVLSGIVLAGANKPLPSDDITSDDGILTAAEVQELDLDRAELVVLSACETGLGQVAGGEGVLGLQRALHMAGARNVVTSLWKVQDEATAALMSLFYHNLWDKQQPPSTALRNAQLTLLHHPEVIGDEQQLQAMATRGLDFTRPQKIDPAAQPAPRRQRAPIHLWAAFTHSGPPPTLAP